MTNRTTLALLLAAALAGCAMPTAPPGPSGPYSLLQAGTRLYPSSVSASSELDYRGSIYTSGRATDANADVEWASADSDPSPSYTLDFGGVQTFNRLRIKTGPSQGTTYRVEASYDGTNWTDISGPLSNASWSIEEKAVSGQGRYLRLRFANTTPPALRHFSIFEIEVYGGGGAAPAPVPPAPSGNYVQWNGLVGDIMGNYGLTPDGGTDASFRLVLTLPVAREVRSIALYGLANGARTGTAWNSANTGNWLLATRSDRYDSAANTFRTTLGTFPAGQQGFWLYGSTSSDWFSSGKAFEVVVTFGDGTTSTYRTVIP